MDPDLQQRINEAIDAVRSRHMSVRAASTQYRIGRMLLQRRVNNDVALLARNGPTPLLTPGEVAGIVEAVNERTLHAQCFTKDELAGFIRVCIENSQHERIVPITFPSPSFVKKFIARNAHSFSTRSSQAMEAVRAKRSTVEVVTAHHTNLSGVLDQHSIPPDCIWNLDETGTCAQGSRNKHKVLASKGLPANVQKPDSRQNISVLVCVSADALPSHTSHFLQPLDVSVFCHFKRSIDKELVEFRADQSRFAVTSDMVMIASLALAKCLTRTYIVAGFEKCGIVPLSLDVMLSKILGDKPGPVAPSTRIGATVQVEKRLLVRLREQGIDVDTASVLCINDNLMHAYTQRTPAAKSDVDWVHGGVLMTADDIASKVIEKEAKKVEKLDILRRKKVQVAKRRVEAASAKQRSNERRREASERKMMHSEDKCKPTRRKRPRSKSGDVVEVFVL